MTTTNWTNALTDSGIKSDMQSFTANGSFSYADALQLLTDVDNRGTVTAAEFADLETIAANLEVQNGISSSTYVSSVFYQLVAGSSANESFTGGTTAATALGNLRIGTGTAQMKELIDKWFLGTDNPDPTGSSDSSQATINPTYQSFATLSLFGPTGAPQVTDVAQGYDGDCELCSGMIEVLLNHPSLINSMFVNDGNGVYGVRFYVDGKETWVTVDSELPVYQGTLLYNDGSLTTANSGLWADLIEKAYAVLSSDGNIGHPAVNSYDNISEDTAPDVLMNLTNASNFQYLLSASANWQAYKNIAIEALAAHNDVILETGSAATDYTTNSSGQDLLIADHAFAVIGYDSVTGDFIVRNPWGSDPYDTSYVTQFEVSMSDIVKVDGDFALDNSAAVNAVVGYAQATVSRAVSTNASFNTDAIYVGQLTTLSVASLFKAIDTAGQAITEYQIELLGTGGLFLNGATNLATAAQTAAGEVVVSAADLSKLTLATGTSGGDIDLWVAGNDGTGWATPTEIYWTVDSAQLTILPAADTIVALLASVSLASLFQVAGPQAGAALSYYIDIESGGGTVNLNGATDLLGGSGSGGQIEVSATDLAKLTYTASSASGVAVIDVTASDGTHFSDVTQVPVDVGYTVSATLAAFDAGETPGQVSVADSAANIFASLDQLEQMMPEGNLTGIVVTDSSIPTETITAAQLTADRGVLSIIDATLVLDVTATGASQSLTGLPNLATVIEFSGDASTYTISATAGSGQVEVTGSSGTTTISGVTAIQFSDYELFVVSETPAVAGGVSSEALASLYAAALSRAPDPAGLNYYQQQASANSALTIVNFASGFLSSPEFTAHYGDITTISEQSFITLLYQNILDRTPAASEVAYYETAMSTLIGGATPGTAAYATALANAHATLLVNFSESPEFLGDVQVTASTPASSHHWLVLV